MTRTHESPLRDPKWVGRVRARDRGYPLAGSSTLNRLELGTAEGAAADRYKRIVAQPDTMDRLPLDVFIESHAKPPKEIWLDLDATDDPLHGRQEGRFFHGYCRHYCYLPLYIFCGEHLLCARLRPSNINASAGSVEELSRIVAKTRERWPHTRIVGTNISAHRADAQCTTIRLKLLKIGARARITERKLWLSFSQSYAHTGAFEQVPANLRTHPPWLARGQPRRHAWPIGPATDIAEGDLRFAVSGIRKIACSTTRITPSRPRWPQFQHA